MFKKNCPVKDCKYGEKGKPKVIEGYTEKHVNSMMKQHMIKHENEEAKNGSKSK